MGKKIVNYNLIISNEIKLEIIKDYTINFLSIREISKKYNIKSKEFIIKVLGNKIRNYKEAGVLAHKKYPNSFKLSEEAKQKIREARLRYMKDHPENTAWRQKNLSFPEKCFYDKLIELEYDKKYLIYREYSVFPYFIDFAFFNEKLAIEIDGSQHLNENQKESDNKKDKLLINNGWTVLRFTAKDVMSNIQFVINTLEKCLSKTNIENIKNKTNYFGILEAPKKYQKKKKELNGRTKLQNESSYNSRKVKNRPSKEELYQLILNNSFSKIGKIYGITGAAISKWCKLYNLPYRRKDIKQLLKDSNKENN